MASPSRREQLTPAAASPEQVISKWQVCPTVQHGYSPNKNILRTVASGKSLSVTWICRVGLLLECSSRCEGNGMLC
eukprot:3157484-Amphidinium_carterae.1